MSTEIPRIHELAPLVIDQIAAGEVVERPAHMIKELVENALDAGANRLEIHIREGGREIQVSDNGWGMYAEDLPKAVSRHATSKIVAADDLFKLRSFGFRGEALASLAAVSEIWITSRPRSLDQATRLHVKFGELFEPERVSGPEGTSLLVRGLFDQLPARKKFLKSDSAELQQIRQVLKALALANPEVEFRVLEEGQLKFFWPKLSRSLDDFLSRAEAILETKSLFGVDFFDEGIQIYGALSSPADVQRTSRQIWIFVQNRFVVDRALQTAILESYRNLLMHGEYPSCVLKIEVDPSFVDVNVHPSKSQVKFQDPALVFRKVVHALRTKLSQAPWQRSSVESPEDPPQALERKQDFFKTEGASFGSTSNYRSGDYSFSQLSSFREPRAEASGNSTGDSLWTQSSLDEKPGPWSRLRVLGQAQNTYILAQDEDKLVLIDQHAAHERVAFEKLKLSLSSPGVLPQQRLLLPLFGEFSEESLEALLKLQPELQAMRIEVEQTGPRTLGLLAHPVLLKPQKVLDGLVRLAESYIKFGQTTEFEQQWDHGLATMACHSVIRAGQALSTLEMESLLKQMDEFPLSGFCPHGRPVSVEYPFFELEKDFGRRS